MTESMKQLVERYNQHGLDKHPYLVALDAQPADLSKVYEIVASARGFAGRFCTWLAGVISRLEDTRLQSVLARQLNDELGNGDPTKVHIGLYDQMLASLAPFKKSAGSDEAGRYFRDEADRCFRAADPYEALGSMIAGEIFAAQFDAWFARQLSRQRELDLAKCTWYSAHETVEVEHANDSTRLASFVPVDDAHQSAVLRGAHNLDAVISGFLDRVAQSQGAAWVPVASGTDARSPAARGCELRARLHTSMLPSSAGGLSGLNAAWALRDRSIAVLEREPRAGGRVLTRSAAGAAYDLGAVFAIEALLLPPELLHCRPCQQENTQVGPVLRGPDFTWAPRCSSVCKDLISRLKPSTLALDAFVQDPKRRRARPCRLKSATARSRVSFHVIHPSRLGRGAAGAAARRAASSSTPGTSSAATKRSSALAGLIVLQPRLLLRCRTSRR